MSKDIFRFKYDREVSTPLALIFLLVFSFAVASYCLMVAKEVTDNAKMSASFNVEIRAAQGKVR